MFIHAGPAGRALPNGHSPVDETQVKTDQEVIRFLTTCGEENLQFLLHPPRLQKALEILDTDNSGEVDEKEWYCLLYTSPSPRDQRGSRMPSSA